MAKTVSNVWRWMQGVDPATMKKPLTNLYYSMEDAGAVVASMYANATGCAVNDLDRNELIQLGAVAIGRVEEAIRANHNALQRAFYAIFPFNF